MYIHNINHPLLCSDAVTLYVMYLRTTDGVVANNKLRLSHNMNNSILRIHMLCTTKESVALNLGAIIDCCPL